MGENLLLKNTFTKEEFRLCVIAVIVVPAILVQVAVIVVRSPDC